MELKGILKTIKLNENTISMLLGAMIVVVVGILVINYFRELRQGSNIASNSQITPESAQTNSPQATPETHTVAKGETLWSIAQQSYGSGYNWVDIAKANKLSNANRLLVGQTLTLPKVEARLAQNTTAGTVIAAKDIPSNSISEDSYTIVKGDHLWGISVRAYGDGYQWVNIAKANKLKNPNLIFAGNTLKLPRGQ